MLSAACIKNGPRRNGLIPQRPKTSGMGNLQCVCVFIKLHITAQSGRHPSHSMSSLVLVLPRGIDTYYENI